MLLGTEILMAANTNIAICWDMVQYNLTDWYPMFRRHLSPTYLSLEPHYITFQVVALIIHGFSLRSVLGTTHLALKHSYKCTTLFHRLTTVRCGYIRSLTNDSREQPRPFTAWVQNLFSTLSSGKEHTVAATFGAVAGAATLGNLCLPFGGNVVVLSSRVKCPLSKFFSHVPWRTS
jgi:hypothetical protein